MKIHYDTSFDMQCRDDVKALKSKLNGTRINWYSAVVINFMIAGIFFMLTGDVIVSLTLALGIIAFGGIGRFFTKRITNEINAVRAEQFNGFSSAAARIAAGFIEGGGNATIDEDVTDWENAGYDIDTLHECAQALAHFRMGHPTSFPKKLPE